MKPSNHALKSTGAPLRRADVMLLLAGVALIVGCSPGIKGDGVSTTTNRPTADFSGIEAAGAYTINWSPGKPALTISTDQNLLPLISTKVDGNTLQIQCEDTLRPTKGITITLSSAGLKKVQLNGAGTLTASKLSEQDLKVECNGAGSINLEGSATNLEVDFAGAGKLDAASLHSQTASISLNGACSADVTATESLKASIAGAGTITYGGNPKSVEKNIDGVGRIQARR